MLEASRRFVRRVLLLHAVLLALVLGVVIFAAHELYQSAREEAIEQTRQRQELLAKQTARGIENYYDSILGNLDLLKRSGDDAADTQPSEMRTATGQVVRIPRLELRRTGFGGANPVNLWRQLEGRVSFMFTFDRHQQQLGLIIPEESVGQSMQIADDGEVREWLNTVEHGEMSPYFTLGNIAGNLIAVPSANAQQVLVAFVPLDTINADFFETLNRERSVTAALLDARGTAMIAVDPRIAGHNMATEFTDPNTRGAVQKYALKGESGSYVFDKAEDFGGTQLPPRITAFEPVTTLPGQRWTVTVTSPLADTENVVAGIFKNAFFWAVFVGLSVTAILVSTAFQLIRSRIKFERTRHELLTRELNQAREIQLAWLPDVTKAPAGVDIAAVNLPASHISGDFYNWFPLAEDGRGSRIAVAIGDVTGHGMAAAFLMATTQLLVRTTMARFHDPGRCLEEINRQLCTQKFRGQFVTMLLMVISPADGTVEIASAGHMAPLVGRNAAFRPLEVESQLVLGFEPRERYQTQRFTLDPDSTLILYTDGVIEAANAAGDQFTTQKFISAASARFSTVQELLANVVQGVKSFCGPQELADDLTLVAVELQPTLVAAEA